MRFNFGHGILIVILSFMAGMSYLVYRCSLQPVGLVSSEYYNQELKYGEQMTKEQNTKALTADADIAFNASSQQVTVRFPFQEDPGISGEILFFKPDNSEYDFTIPVKVDADAIQQVNAAKLPGGAWRVKINWKVKGTAYYSEKKIFIN